MDILITERTDITPLLGMDWMKKFRLTLGRIQLAENKKSERQKVFDEFAENNETKKDTEINIQLKPGHYPKKQKARPVPLHRCGTRARKAYKIRTSKKDKRRG